jgi:hypothetical protein
MFLECGFIPAAHQVEIFYCVLFLPHVVGFKADGFDS